MVWGLGFLAISMSIPPRKLRTAIGKKAYVYVPNMSRINPAKGDAINKREFMGTKDIPRIFA